MEQAITPVDQPAQRTKRPYRKREGYTLTARGMVALAIAESRVPRPDDGYKQRAGWVLTEAAETLLDNE